MNINLDKEDLVNLVRGCTPNYDVMENQLIREYGSYSGSYDRWDWNYYKLLDKTEEGLIEMYYICKNSWSKK